MNNNPIRLTDPDGGSPQDIILHGKNNSSYTIKAPGDDIHLDVPVDFGGVLDAGFSLDVIPDLSSILIGYEGSFEGGAAVVGSGDLGPRVGAFMLLGGDYKGYWYPYVGVEARGGLGFDFGFDVNTQGSFFIGINKSGNLHPRAFFGSSIVSSVNVGAYAGLGAEGSYSYYGNNHWEVHAVTFGGGVGDRITIGNFQVGGSKSWGLTNQYIKTSDRSWYDIAYNQYMYNPLF